MPEVVRCLLPAAYKTYCNNEIKSQCKLQLQINKPKSINVRLFYIPQYILKLKLLGKVAQNVFNLSMIDLSGNLKPSNHSL